MNYSWSSFCLLITCFFLKFFFTDFYLFSRPYKYSPGRVYMALLMSSASAPRTPSVAWARVRKQTNPLFSADKPNWAGAHGAHA